MIFQFLFIAFLLLLDWQPLEPLKGPIASMFRDIRHYRTTYFISFIRHLSINYRLALFTINSVLINISGCPCTRTLGNILICFTFQCIRHIFSIPFDISKSPLSSNLGNMFNDTIISYLAKTTLTPRFAVII